MDGQLESLIDALDVASDERMVRGALKRFAIACGYERFAYLQTAAAEIKTFNSYLPEWQDIYFENRYSRIDPVVTTAKRRREMFAWSADDWNVRDMTKEEKLFRSQAIDFGIRCGLAIPVEGSFGSILMLTLATSQKHADASALGDRARAERAVLYAHHRLRVLAEPSLSAPKLALSPKELVCLKWAAKGKYMPEIAEVTNTPVSNGAALSRQCPRQLGATNLTHAVAIAKDRGLLEPE